MNQIIKSLLSDFVKDQKFLTGAPQDVAFEHFAANLTAGLHIEETLDTKHCVMGEDAQPAIDGVATIVNGRLVVDEVEIDSYAELNNYLDVDFVFIQAKTSPSFDASALGDLGDWVERIFLDGPNATDNAKTVAFDKLRKKIYSKAKLFKRRRPIAYLYYVSTGIVPDNDGHFLAKERLIKKRLGQTGDLEDVQISLVGATSLQKRSHQLQNSIEREINFSKKISLPDVPGVKQAFLGVLPLSEFIKLIQSEGGSLLSTIFYDNVRDWQGMNSVNGGMQLTLQNEMARSRFVLMNNGVTIIAKQIRMGGGDKLIIEDYQIVNGCQTSNVIWENKRLLEDSSEMIPLKIVATDDEAVIKDIIRATNSQTNISAEQLLAVTDFQKELELFFASQGEQSLYYERRSRQFANKSVERSRIVAPLGLIKAYASMFLMEPHKTTRDFNSILAKVGSDIFGKNHKYDFYYLSALALYWIQVLIPKINPRLAIARYQVLMCVRILYEAAEPPSPNSKKCTKYVDELKLLFKDAKTAEATLRPAMKVVEGVMKGKTRDGARTSAFTHAVNAAASSARASLSKGGAKAGSDPIKRRVASKNGVLRHVPTKRVSAKRGRGA